MTDRRATCLVLMAVACGPSALPGEDDGSTSNATSTTVSSMTSPPLTTNSTTTTPSVTSLDDANTDPPEMDSSEGTDTTEPPVFGDWFRVDMPVDDCEPVGPQGLPGVNLDLIWVANNSEGTLSKIDTLTLVELGRYQAAPVPSNPSNVSVALSGSVAVANEDGGITKYYATDCPDPLNTSTGPGDVYDWGEDGCLAWHTSLAGMTLPVAWAAGTYDQVACEWVDEVLWTTEYVGGTSVSVHLLDGDTGVVNASATVDGYPAGMGPRTGAVDSEGNFWFIPTGPGPLVRVDILSLTTEQWDLPSASAGIAVDPMLGIWTCGASGLARFDLGTQMFETFDGMVLGTGPLAGCASDGDALWLAGDSAVWSFRLDTQMVEFTGAMIEPVQGVAIDWSGAVWFAAGGTTRLHRLLPALAQIDTVDGLQNPTAISDMTGYALAHVTN